jgi:hypothetical protein
MIHPNFEEHLPKFVVSHQMDWDARLFIFLLAYRKSILKSTALTSTILASGRELSLTCYS